MAEKWKKIIFVRHGKSVTNRDNIYQAGDQFIIDPLDEQGEQEAERLAQRFGQEQFNAEIIVSSSYLRAIQTAQKIARVTLSKIVIPVYHDRSIVDIPSDELSPESGKSLFRELDLPSELQGMSFNDEAALSVKEQINEHRYEPHWHFSDEENYFDVWIRAKECLDYLARRKEQRIIVVSHGGLIKACLARMLFDEEREFSTPEKLEAYHAFAAHTWFDNTGIVSTRHSDQSGEWQWMISANDHLPGPFGYVSTEESDSSADELLHRKE